MRPRSMLLLRLATGSTQKLVGSAGLSGGQMEFWWSKLGLHRGLWTGNRSRADLFDLWDDIELLIGEARKFKEDTAPADQTFHLIGNQIPQVVTGLGGCERVAIWNLAAS
jgi:hypothetical protein